MVQAEAAGINSLYLTTEQARQIRKETTRRGKKNHVQPLWSPHEAQLQLTLICRGIVVVLVEVLVRTLGGLRKLLT